MRWSVLRDETSDDLSYSVDALRFKTSYASPSPFRRDVYVLGCGTRLVVKKHCE